MFSCRTIGNWLVRLGVWCRVLPLSFGQPFRESPEARWIHRRYPQTRDDLRFVGMSLASGERYVLFFRDGQELAAKCAVADWCANPGLSLTSAHAARLFDAIECEGK